MSSKPCTEAGGWGVSSHPAVDLQTAIDHSGFSNKPV